MRNELFENAVKERIRNELRDRETSRRRRPVERPAGDPKHSAAHKELYPDPKKLAIQTGPDPKGYDGRSLEEMSAEERYAVRSRRAEIALAMGLAITDAERELLGLK
jgi:hypothetical protein